MSTKLGPKLSVLAVRMTIPSERVDTRHPHQGTPLPATTTVLSSPFPHPRAGAMLASSSPGGPSPSSTPATTTTTSSAAPPDTAVGPPAGAPSSLQQQVQQHQQQQQSQHQQQQQVGPSLGLPSDAMNSMSVGQLKAAAQLSKPKVRHVVGIDGRQHICPAVLTWGFHSSPISLIVAL